MDGEINASDTGPVVLDGGRTMAVISEAANVIHGMPVTLTEVEGFIPADGTVMNKHIQHVPVTFVVSNPPVNVDHKLISEESHHSTPVISAINLQDGETTTQYFIEHISSGAPHLQNEEGEAVHIGVSPTMATMTNGNGLPVLLQVAENMERQPNEPGVNSSIPSAQEAVTSTSTDSNVSEDGSTTMYTIHLTEEGLTSENDRLSQENVDMDPTADSESQAAENSMKQIAFTPAETPSLQLLPANARLEDFMDVVTTYKCKFCRFSCAWKSGLMSHIRSCHLEASQKGLIAGSDDPSLENKDAPLSQARERQTVSVAQTKDPVQPTEPLCLLDSGTLSEVCSTPASNGMPPPQERHIFLCGQCSQSFESLEGCKQHMIKDHSIKIDVATTGHLQRNSPSRKRPSTKSKSSSSSETKDGRNDFGNTEEMAEGQEEQDATFEKRKVKAPRGLEVDYLLGTRKKRAYRDTMSDRPYKCNEKGCGYRFRNESNLQYHSRCHNNNGEKLFICPECTELMDHWRNVTMHLWKVHNIDLDLHTCPDCGYKTYSLFKLDNHKRIHREEREFVCQKCGKGFKQLSQLRNHHVIHLDRKNMPEKRWYSEQECDICHRTFSDSKCLRKHQQAVHNKIKPYICTFCGHTSARKAMLQLHMRQHTGEKPFVCDYCEYRTGDHNSLRRHRMRHTGTKPYKCPHCSYACIQAISYKTHLKNKHPGMSGLFACPLCSFRSVSNENYMNHMSDHKRGEIPITTEGSIEEIIDQEESSMNTQTSHYHLPDSTLQQLEGILPGNMTAAQLICSCLNALQEGGAVNLPPGVTTTSTGDGTQTITIQFPMPGSQGMGEAEQYYLTIQQDASQPLLSPAALESQDNSSNNDDTILHPITILQADEGRELDSNSFITSEVEDMHGNSEEGHHETSEGKDANEDVQVCSSDGDSIQALQ